jgi:histidinol-phosphatase (PHP family)
MVCALEDYNATYDGLEVPGLKIRLGMEYGITPFNVDVFRQDLQRRHFDFIIGSVHLVDGMDVYLAPYWVGKTPEQVVPRYLEEVYRSVAVHTDYDVLGHMTFISKARGNPNHKLVGYAAHREIIDEILRELVRHDKGLEVNTSGIDRCGGPLPTLDMVKRFRELGGKIVTVGSDAHSTERLGQYVPEMEKAVKEIFGYVCTFENRVPVFHK